MKNSIRNLAIVIIFILLVTGCSNNKKEKIVKLNVSAAASLKEVMIDIKENYESINKNIELVINYGSSGSLKQQIQHGAPCDIFISAGKNQIDDLDKDEFLISDSVKQLVKNELVLIGPKNSKLNNINDLNMNEVKHIGVGSPESVPAGKYADEALINLDLKEKIKDKLVFAKDVKEVLAWVQSENADAGFVYFSDTIDKDNIKIIEVINKDAHSEIIYPVVITKDSKNIDKAREFEEFLLGDKGQKIFKKYGYR